MLVLSQDVPFNCNYHRHHLVNYLREKLFWKLLIKVSNCQWRICYIKKLTEIFDFRFIANNLKILGNTVEYGQIPNTIKIWVNLLFCVSLVSILLQLQFVKHCYCLARKYLLKNAIVWMTRIKITVSRNYTSCWYEILYRARTRYNIILLNV